MAPSEYVYLRNKFDLWNVHGIMTTSGLLQSKPSPKGFALTCQEFIYLSLFKEDSTFSDQR